MDIPELSLVSFLQANRLKKNGKMQQLHDNSCRILPNPKWPTPME